VKIGVFLGNSTDSLVQQTVEAFISGLDSLGENFFVSKDYQKCDVAVIWGITSNRALKKTKYRDQIRSAHPHTIVIERGFIKRDDYFSVGWGDTGGLGDYVNSNVGEDRWNLLNVPMSDWKKDGDYILVCGQVAHDTAVQHVDYRTWLKQKIESLRVTSNRPIVFRPHPLYKGELGPFSGVTTSKKSLEDDFSSAFAVVTLNSTSGVESVLEGIPTFSFHKRSMVYEVSNHHDIQVNQPQKPDRQDWAHKIAYSQWSTDEISCGKPWLHLKQRFG